MKPHTASGPTPALPCSARRCGAAWQGEGVPCRGSWQGGAFYAYTPTAHLCMRCRATSTLPLCPVATRRPVRWARRVAGADASTLCPALPRVAAGHRAGAAGERPGHCCAECRRHPGASRHRLHSYPGWPAGWACHEGPHMVVVRSTNALQRCRRTLRCVAGMPGWLVGWHRVGRAGRAARCLSTPSAAGACRLPPPQRKQLSELLEDLLDAMLQVGGRAGPRPWQQPAEGAGRKGSAVDTAAAALQRTAVAPSCGLCLCPASGCCLPVRSLLLPCAAPPPARQGADHRGPGAHHQVQARLWWVGGRQAGSWGPWGLPHRQTQGRGEGASVGALGEVGCRRLFALWRRRNNVALLRPLAPAGGGLAADISLGAENGAQAVDFVRRQVLAVPPLRPLCLAVKAFLRWVWPGQGPGPGLPPLWPSCIASPLAPGSVATTLPTPRRPG